LKDLCKNAKTGCVDLSLRHVTYEKLWNTLAEFNTATAKENRRLQPEIIAELRSTRSLINILKTASKDTDLEDDVIPRIEAYLLNIKSNLVSKAANLGEDFLALWIDKLRQVYSETSDVKQIKSVRFIPNIARNYYWMRIKITPKTSVELVEDVSSIFEVSIKQLNDEYVLVYGDKNTVHKFVKEMSKRTQRMKE
jgi:hypothetical protein